MRWWLSSVCPSILSRASHGKLKIGRKEAHESITRGTRDSWPQLEVERSKVKVTRPLNAVADNQPSLQNGKADELQTWCTDGAPRAALTSAMTFELKVLGGCLSHHLREARACCGGRTACCLVAVCQPLIKLLLTYLLTYCCAHLYATFNSNVLSVYLRVTDNACDCTCNRSRLFVINWIGYI